MRRLGALGLATAAVGLPVNDLMGYGALVAAAVFLFCGTVSAAPRRWLMAVAFTLVAVAGHVLLPAPRIHEGANAFLISQDGTARNETGLPDDAFRHLKTAFDAQYPPETRCDETARGCWRSNAAKEKGFAFAADGLYDRARDGFSRRVGGIGFSDPAKLRLGFINDIYYNWIDEVSDVQRFDRERKPSQILDRYKLLLPVFIAYRFPQAFAGGKLCWRGEVLWEGGGERFAPLSHDETACRALTTEDIGRRIVGVSIRNDRPLSMSLRPPLLVTAARAIKVAFTLLGVVGVVGSLTAWRKPALWRRVVLPLTLLGIALSVVAIDDFEFIGGLRPLDRGDDGIMYEGWGRDIVRHLVSGDIAAALRGEEPVFYFTPLMRYVRALELLVFGDTFLLYLSGLLLVPLMMYALCRRFMPEGWAIGLALVFTATPLGALFGSSFHLFARAAGRGYPDVFAYVLFLGGLLLVVPRFTPGAASPSGDARSASRALWAGVLFGLAIMTRPNMLLASGVMIAAAAIFALRERAPARAVAIVAGACVVLLSPLHNWVFGGSLVPFSDNMIQPATMRMLPSAYFKAAWELLRLDLAGENLAGAIRQISHWLSGPGEFLAAIPLNAFAVGLLVYVGLFGRKHDPWLRAIALATLLQHGIGLCYVIYDRYHLLTWLLTALVFWAWLYREGLPALAAKAPSVFARLSARAPLRWVAATLDRLPATFARA